MTATRVLIVEDDPNIVDLIRSNLLVRGFDVQVSSSGSDALELIEKSEPSIVLLDLMLPTVNGFDLCREIRQQSDVGLIVVSARADESDKVRALGVDAGAGCVLPTRETIEAGEYVPLSRPLYIYVNAESLGRPEVVAFVEFYMDNAAELAAEVGYIGLSEAEYSANIDAIK